MDPKKSNQEYGWTNERHLRFLNSMEASFVRTMLENNGHGHARLLRRMARSLPDSSESTIDSKINSQRERRHSTSDILKHPRIKIDQKVGISPLDQDDQVVPQFESISRKTNDEKDELK